MRAFYKMSNKDEMLRPHGECAFKKHCQRHNGPRVLSLTLEFSLQLNSIQIQFSWKDNSSHRLNTLGPLCLWQCFSFYCTLLMHTFNTLFKWILETFTQPTHWPRNSSFWICNLWNFSVLYFKIVINFMQCYHPFNFMQCLCLFNFMQCLYLFNFMQYYYLFKATSLKSIQVE